MDIRDIRYCEAPGCRGEGHHAQMVQQEDGSWLCPEHADVGMLDRCDSPQDAGACATMRERLVAGTNAPIPACPVHGEWSE